MEKLFLHCLPSLHSTVSGFEKDVAAPIIILVLEEKTFLACLYFFKPITTVFVQAQIHSD